MSHTVAPGPGPAHRRPLVAGNWKMNGLRGEAVALVKGLLAALGAGDLERVEVVVCPPFTVLGEVARALEGTGIGLGAQNVHWADRGAFTGEVSGPMLVELGCSYVIVGHSERRQFFGETDETAGRRLGAALRHGLTPILCVGETWEERETGRTQAVVERQLRTALEVALREEPGVPAVAYEPVWAIGSGRPASGADAQEVAAFIRSVLADVLGPERAAAARVLYGGSVKADNVADFTGQPDVDGALVGGASLSAEGFAALVRQVCR
ncbi:MAG: triose-phosphate isomerase [Firmicutes bacterium]|nr:triose-phosphate isomerase [Bacillota bacterium]